MEEEEFAIERFRLLCIHARLQPEEEVHASEQFAPDIAPVNAFSSCRTFFFFAVFACGLVPLARSAGGTSISVSLADLDLNRAQAESGPVQRGEQFRSDRGVVLPAGASLWVDLKRGAEELRVVAEPLSGSRGAPVRCRFATANDVWEVLIRPESGPQSITLPLAGQDLLVIEAIATTPGESVSVHFTSSSISAKAARPEAIAGLPPVTWETPQWQVRVDGRSGGLSHLAHPKDPLGMEWVRQAAPWGTGWARIEGVMTAWDRPVTVRRVDDHTVESVYELPRLRVRVLRKIETEGRLRETFTFENTGSVPLVFAEDGLGIRLPLVDNYPGAEVCLPQRCHAHLWMGGSSAYVNALRMGGAAPHLGLVLTQGRLTSYSIHDRTSHSNDRGQFVLHPAAATLQPGESQVLSWVLFWHEGWEDFYRQAGQLENFLRLEAERYTLTRGENLRVTARAAAPLEGARWLLNGKPVTSVAKASADAKGEVQLELPMTELGEQLLELDVGGRRASLRAFVTPPPLELIAQRVRFIVEHQQKHAANDPLGGAYLIFDNETNALVYDGSFSDHNAGRERLGMGVLAAMYYPYCRDAAFREQIARSLEEYAAFVRRELQNDAGTVFNDVRRSGPTRMYNYPWVIHFYVAMYEAFERPEYLRRALDATRAYYAKGGERFYCIGLPVLPLLRSLEKAGWSNERKEMLAAFKKHADTLLKIGSAYPKHEVNYEQSIVGPAAQLMLEVYLATRDPVFLRGAEEQLKLLELFGGRQPDYHLNDIAIRHWDDYWFGKRQVYADTFPHYWSTITGVVFDDYALATSNVHYRQRAEGILANNLCNFTPEGRASCAYVYPTTVNGQPGKFFDPWANDQDWALVNWLLVNPPVK